MTRPMPDVPNKRIQLDLSPDMKEKLKLLRERTDSASYTEVFRRGLIVYDFVSEHQPKGRKFGFLDETGCFNEVFFVL